MGFKLRVLEQEKMEYFDSRTYGKFYHGIFRWLKVTKKKNSTYLVLFINLEIQKKKRKRQNGKFKNLLNIKISTLNLARHIKKLNGP